MFSNDIGLLFFMSVLSVVGLWIRTVWDLFRLSGNVPLEKDSLNTASSRGPKRGKNMR